MKTKVRWKLLLFIVIAVRIFGAHGSESEDSIALSTVATALEAKGRKETAANMFLRAYAIDETNTSAIADYARITNDADLMFTVFKRADDKVRPKILAALKNMDNTVWKTAVAFEEYDTAMLRIIKAAKEDYTRSEAKRRLLLCHEIVPVVPVTPPLTPGSYDVLRGKQVPYFNGAPEAYEFKADGSWRRPFGAYESARGTWTLKGDHLTVHQTVLEGHPIDKFEEFVRKDNLFVCTEGDITLELHKVPNRVK